MKRAFKFLLLLTMLLNAQSYQDEWSVVQKLEGEKRPKQALELVERIYRSAKRENNQVQYIKALLHKEKYIYILERDFNQRVKEITQEIESATDIGTKLILKSILAGIYRDFLNKRTRDAISYIDDEQNGDIYSWSLKRIENMASKLFLESLGSEAKKIPITKYREILLDEKNSQNLRPTLYDFLAFRALNFFNYQNPLDGFYLDKKDAFGDVNHFLKYNFNPKNRKLLRYTSIKIYKELLKFHRKDGRVLDYVNMERLKFVYDNFIEFYRDEYYLDALKSLKSGDIRNLYLAKYYFERGDYKRAITYANRGLQSRDMYVSTDSKAIKNDIEVHHIGLTLEDVNLPNENILARIDYRNVSKIYARVVKLNPEEYAKIYPLYGEEREKFVRSLKYFKEFNISLPKTEDYQAHSTEVSLGSYGFGKYIFMLSEDSNFSKNITYTISTISKLAYFNRKSEILVVDRATGYPLKDVNVTLQNGDDEVITTLRSDAKGLVKIPPNIKQCHYTFQYGEDILDFKYDRFYCTKEKPKKGKNREKVYFYIDKPIYRPSQTILFKGLVVKEFDYKRPKIIPNRRVKVTLYNSLNEELESKIFKTDEFGSIYGSFEIPKGAKDGYLHLSSNIQGSQKIKIKRYKKDTFVVTFDRLSRYRLGERVKLKGKLITRRKLDGVQIEYTVTRLVTFPWFHGDMPKDYKNRVVVAKGSMRSNIDGEFEIPFIAESAPFDLKKYKPTFSYRVLMRIKAPSGDIEEYTKVVNIGYINLNVDMQIDENLDKNGANHLKLVGTDLYGNFEPIDGELEIYKLKPKARVYRDRYWDRVDKLLYSKEEFEGLFQSYEYPTATQMEQKIQSLPFDTGKSKEILLENLTSGEYILKVITEDRDGVEAIKTKRITVYGVDEPHPPKRVAIWNINDKPEYSVGSIATVYIKSSIPHSSIFFKLDRGDRGIKEEWIDINGSTKKSIKISKEDRGDVFYSILMVKNNRAYIKRGILKVPWDNKLEIEYISFRDRIEPNSKEQWKIKVKSKEEAQMVATLYSSSLDSLKRGSFSTYNLYPKHRPMYENRWVATHFSYRTYASSWRRKSEYMRRVFYRLNPFGFHMNSFYLNERENHLSDPHTTPTETGVSIEDIIEEAKSENHSSIIDLNDRLLFEPKLQTDGDGEINIEFKTDETLAKWNFLGFIHTKDLKVAWVQREVITQKELDVKPTLPNFFREGDELVIPNQIVNLGREDVEGDCFVKILDSNRTIYSSQKKFKVPKGSSTTLDFRVKIPTLNSKSVKYIVGIKHYQDEKIVTIPIFPSEKIEVEGMALFTKGKESRKFTLKPLEKSDSKRTKNRKLVVEFTSNPAWYAILAMPYIMKYPNESSEALFNKYFVSSIALKILNNSSKMQEIFKSWQEEGKEEQLTKLFNIDRLKFERRRSYGELMTRQFQHHDGGWSWFKGGVSNWYMTQYIVEKFGRLKKFGIDRRDTEMMGVATAFMDRNMYEEYQKAQQDNPESDHLTGIIIHYLYARSFYNNLPILHKGAYNYYLNQAKRYWKRKNIYQQAMIALTLNRKLGKNEAIEIANSIKERAIQDKTRGIYFGSSMETHTRIMELFDEVLQDKKLLEQMKIWILDRKGLRHWSTTKDTATAIDALLSDNAWILNKSKLAQLDFNTTINYKPILKRAKERATKGIEYFRVEFDEFNQSMATIQVTNPNGIPLWGSFHWEYSLKEGSVKKLPIKLSRKVFIERESKIEKRLVLATKENIKLGDKLKVELKIDVDRDMNYITLRDDILSPFTPINGNERYKYLKGVGYYEALRDDGLYLFFQKLPKGVYKFEYYLYVTHRGRFESGGTTVQSFYSPKLYTHIEGSEILIK